MNQDLISSSLSIPEAYKFCQLFSSGLSFRLVAESEELKNKIKDKGKEFSIIKLLAHEAGVEERLQRAREFNDRGYAVFYLPTLFSPGAFETYEKALFYRAFVVDLDGSPLASVLDSALEPSMVIESSPGKYQVIWMLEGEGIAAVKSYSATTSGVLSSSGSNNSLGLTADDYNETAAKLAALFDGDLNVCRATQAFRLPGFKHWKNKELKDGYQSHILWESSNRYRISDISNFLKEFSSNVKNRIAARKNGSRFNPVDKEQSYNRGIGRNFDAKIDLTSLKLGEIKVEKGLRHSTLLRLAVELFHSGLSDAAVKEEVLKIVKNSFDGGEDFSSGGRARELSICIGDAKRYFIKNNNEYERNLAASVNEIAGKAGKNGQNEESISLLSNGDKLSNGNGTEAPPSSDYGYNYDLGTLKLEKYSESGIVDRCLQRFDSDLANIDGRMFCYNRTEKLWLTQVAGGCSEIKARVLKCINDACSERDFIRLFCTDKKGNRCENKEHSAKAPLLKIAAIHSMCGGVMNHIAVKKYKYSEFDAVAPLFYAANGVVNMLTGEIREARAEDRLLCRSPVSFNNVSEFGGVYGDKTDFSLVCPGWIDFLTEIFAENDSAASMITFIQELFGYSLSGDMSAEKIFCHYGSGANGKSKLLSAIKKSRY